MRSVTRLDDKTLEYLAAHKDVLDQLDEPLRTQAKDLLYKHNLIPPDYEMLSIRTKDAQLVRLKPNVVQRTLLDTWKHDYPEFSYSPPNLIGLVGARETILKARQEGISTLVEATAYLLATTQPYWVSLIVADTRERAQMLFQMISRFREHDPRNLRTKRENVGEIYFSDLDSLILVGTAGDKNVGRAATVNFLHMTELAFWTNWDVRGALLDAVPLQSGIVIEETTANGINPFYEHYTASANGLTLFKTRFIPWFALPEYRVEHDGEPTENEYLVMQKYNVDKAQARWYVMKRMEKATTAVPMEQEYPGTPEEAFVSTAWGAVFDSDAIKRMLDQAPDPIAKKVPGDDGLGGFLDIYSYPVPNADYVIGADVAEGISGDGDHDYSTADVFRADTWEHVASYYGRPPLSVFAADLDGLSAFYNGAIIVVERNNQGYAVCMELERIGANIYYHRTAAERTPQAGFPSTVKTKALRDNVLRNAIAEWYQYGEGIVIKGKRALKELLAYQELPGQKRGAPAHAHDDHVTSVGLAVWYMSEYMPRTIPHMTEQEPWPGYQPGWGRKAVIMPTSTGVRIRVYEKTGTAVVEGNIRTPRR